jgi:hypothetical protein
MMLRILVPGEGLEKENTSLSQIPTYVTGVPNGTEKVYIDLQRYIPIVT